MIFLGLDYPTRPGVAAAYPDATTAGELRAMADECDDPALAGLLRLAARDAEQEARGRDGTRDGDAGDDG